MSKAYVHLGKNGDVISALPILHQDFKQTGIKPVLVISSQYVNVLKSVSYVEPCVFEGHWQDLFGAIKFAKQQFDEVVVLSTYGQNFPIQKRTPSFQLDQWLRGGCMEKFGTLKPVFDLRDKAREKVLLRTHVKHGEKFILLCDASESSPFPQREELQKLLRDNFPTHKIVLTSDIKAEFFTDCLGIYDKAAALVSIDTAHLHLSTASKVPVFALASDKPELWHGTFYQERFHFYARYSEWDKRKQGLIDGVKAIISNPDERKPLNPRAIVKEWFKGGLVPPLNQQANIQFANNADFGYNPSAVEWNGRIYTSYRAHHPRSHKTYLLVDGKRVEPPEACKDMSMEDARLFIRKGALHASYVVSNIPLQPATCVIAYGELVEGDKAWTIKNHTVPKMAGNNFTGLNKNWVLFENAGKLYAIYSSEPEHKVIELDGDKVGNALLSDAPKWRWGSVRGGCMIPHGETYLRFFHSRTDKPTPRYYIGAMIMANRPPFNILKVGSEPILTGSEWEKREAFHFKPNVVFPLGVVKHGSDFLLSVGVNDSDCAMVRLKEGDLRL